MTGSRGHLGLRQNAAHEGLHGLLGAQIGDSPSAMRAAAIGPLSQFDRSFETFRLTVSSNAQASCAAGTKTSDLIVLVQPPTQMRRGLDRRSRMDSCVNAVNLT